MDNVLDLQWMEVGEMPAEQLDPLSRTMAFHLRKLIDERDESAEVRRSYQHQLQSAILFFLGSCFKLLKRLIITD